MRLFRLFFIIAATISLVMMSVLTYGEAGAKRPTVAVVLGGGAARGLSHIGLLKSLAEEGIPVDVLVGTSMGSIVAGLHAAGLSVENLEYLVEHVDLAELFHPNVPMRGGVINTDRFSRFLDIITDGATFNDVSVDFYSVITQLDSGEELGLHHGSIGRAIVASMAIPGMFPPVDIDGQFYVDGGIKSPVPVDFTRGLDVDVIIAVDVRRTLEHIDYDSLLTNVQLSLFFLLDANTMWQLDLADVVVAPEVQTDSYMDYDRAPFFIEEGYRATKEVMPEIREALLRLDPDFPFGDRPPPQGIPHEELVARIQSGLRAASDGSGAMSLAPSPEITFFTDRPTLLRFGLHIPLGDPQRSLFNGYYAFQGRGDVHLHTAGVATRRCRLLCVGLFARKESTDAVWTAGIGAAGRVHSAAQYRLEWELGRPGFSAWRVQLRTPVIDDVVTRTGEFLLDVAKDPRGLYDVYGDGVTARARVRLYFPGANKNIAELLRGRTTWYVGLGATSHIHVDPVGVTPTAEAGLLMEGRLFGLYPLRTRLALHYAGGDGPWMIRWTFGE